MGCSAGKDQVQPNPPAEHAKVEDADAEEVKKAAEATESAKAAAEATAAEAAPAATPDDAALVVTSADGAEASRQVERAGRRIGGRVMCACVYQCV